MRLNPFFSAILLALSLNIAQGQTHNRVLDIFPEGTILHGNIPYANDTLKKHLLDIYLPANATGKIPLVIWVHGGGWLSNDKYADMGYMKATIAEILKAGYALASIDYRFSTQAVFPAQIQDCNQAVKFLHENAAEYGFDTQRFALMGFSAGGHLAAMMGLSANNKVPDFNSSKSGKSIGYKAVVDFYGPADLTLFPKSDDPKSPEGILIGAAPLDRPDLSKIASPVTYVDKDDPPFLIIHGEKDDLVSPNHSKLLSGWLTTLGVKNELIVVKDAPHFGPQFDVEEVRTRVMDFLKTSLK